uniref:Uncharacterized protein n=1 Tax=Arundo donax TaxID=35708 RepID=A0A0A8Z539_ARUDO
MKYLVCRGAQDFHSLFQGSKLMRP